MTILDEPTATPGPAVARYLAAVEAELGDLPADERAELLEDLASHLSEVADEAGDDDLESRLGAPSAYAAELRASAGLGSPSPAPSTRRGRLDDLVIRARRTAVGWRLAKWWPELKVAGWFVVGAVVAELLVRLVDIDGNVLANGPFQVLGGVVALCATRRSATTVWGRRLRYAVAGAAVIAGVALALDMSGGPDVVYYENNYGTEFFYPGGPGYASDGRPIMNVYPYSLDGQLLDGVLLYDQDGIPINAGDSYNWPAGETPIPANQYPRPEPEYPTVPQGRSPSFESPATTAPPVTMVPMTSAPAPLTSAAPNTTSAPEATAAPATTPAPSTTAPPETTAAIETTVTPTSAG